MTNINNNTAASRKTKKSAIRASRELGQRYMDGVRVFTNTAKGIKHLSDAAIAGDITSQNLIKRFVRQTLLTPMPKP